MMTKELRLALLSSLLVHLVILLGMHDIEQMPGNESSLSRDRLVQLQLGPAKAISPRLSCKPLGKLRRIVAARRVTPWSSPPGLRTGNVAHAAPAELSAQIRASEMSLPQPAVEKLAAEGIAAVSDGKRQYLLGIAREARRYKEYPAAARDRAWEGLVVIEIRSVAFGSPQISLAQSSGFAILDRQALDMAEQAIQRAAVPESLQAHGFVLSLPVRYSLAD